MIKMSKIKERILKPEKEKPIVICKENHTKVISRSIRRNFAKQKVGASNIQSTERKKRPTKDTPAGKAVIQNCRTDKELSRQPKAERVHHYYTGLKKILKGLLYDEKKWHSLITRKHKKVKNLLEKVNI